MAAKGYTTRGNIENYLLITIDPSFYTQIDTWMSAVEAYIDSQTGRNFVPGDATAQLYPASGCSQALLIDDCTEITSVEIGDLTGTTFTAVTDYLALPLNTRPITCLSRTSCPWPRGIHRVTAKWGYQSAVPADITLAATVLMAGIINYTDDGEGEVQSMNMGRYSVSYKSDQGWKDFERIPETLAAYRKHIL